MQSLNPTDDSGVASIVPAVPSSSGVADVFAFNGDGTVSAITSDGTTAWTADVSQAAWQPLPDFRGGLVMMTSNSIVGLDGMTGRPAFTYTPADGWLGSSLAVHPDGTVFAILVGNSWSLIGIDPTTGATKFSVPIPPANVSQEPAGGIIIAGDGYAYVPHLYAEFPSPCGPDGSLTQLNHLKLLRVGSDGSYDDFGVFDWLSPSWCHEGTVINWLQMITNADTGIVLSWVDEEGSPGYGQPRMAVTTGASASVVNTPGAGQFGVITPVLQAQDGSFVGASLDADWNPLSMIGFDASGNLLWSVGGNWQPQIATADGGLIATDQDTGAAVGYGQNGNAKWQMGDLPDYSWRENAYRDGLLDQVVAIPLLIARGFWPIAFANLSFTSAAIQQPYYAPLKSCPGASPPCPREAISSALTSLKAILQSPCPACNAWVFNRLLSIDPGASQTSFFQYLALKPRLWDGTRSYAPANVALCPSGFFNRIRQTNPILDRRAGLA